MPINLFWFRRDLRVLDNAGLTAALESGTGKVLPLFIFDPGILDPLPPDDHRVNFIYQTLRELDGKLREHGSCLRVFRGDPVEVFRELLSSPDTVGEVRAVYCNEDYEPYARKRDDQVRELLASRNLPFHAYTDQVIFPPWEILKGDGHPYTVYTPYKNRWLSALTPEKTRNYGSADLLGHLLPCRHPFPAEEEVGIRPVPISVPSLRREKIAGYDQARDFPAADGGSYAGVYLRFGLVSIRELVQFAFSKNDVYLSELVWREFFMHVLWHFPESAERNFKSKYDAVPWRNDREEFQTWCRGDTGFPLVDAGMRELNRTGFISNRVRMVAAGFLCKHLLIDWRWGERYFARKLFDYELASNVGNWQWSAGTGCDAAPYFRIFNPEEQARKFDPENAYIKKWVPEFASPEYRPMIEHRTARERALQAYGIIKKSDHPPEVLPGDKGSATG